MYLGYNLRFAVITNQLDFLTLKANHTVCQSTGFPVNQEGF